MSSLSRDFILAADDRKTIEVNVPEWGGSVFVRTMTASERDAFEARQQRDPYKDLRARLAVATVADAEGHLLFTEADVPAIGAKNSKALDRIFAVSLRHNGISKDDVEELRSKS